MKCLAKLQYVNIYALVVFVLFFIEWRYFTIEVNYATHNIIGTLLKYLGEGIIIVAPLYFFNGKWRRIALVVLWLVSLLMLSNVLYYRFWNDIMGVDTVMLWSNVNLLLLNSMVGLAELADITFIIIPLLLTVVYCRKHNAIESVDYRGVWLKSCFIGVLLGCTLLSQLTYAFGGYRYMRSIGSKCDFMFSFISRYHYQIFSNLYEYNNLGGMCFSIKSLYDALKYHRTVKIDDTTGIDNFISEVGKTNRTNSNIPDSVVSVNSGKNLILIVVESLNSDVIGKAIGGHKITPVLDSLLAADGTVSSLNMVTQINKGGSSDGQLIINTGLLPLFAGATAMTFSTRIEMPSLVKQLKKDNNISVFADNAGAWKQREVYNNFGFDVYCSNDFMEEIKAIGSDGAMFRFGEKLISDIRGSFFLEFITIAMHTPFEEPGVPMQQWLEQADLSKIERNYLNSVNYFDRELGHFIDWLKDKGLYDNSIIAIVSDHSQTVDDITSNDIYTEHMAFIAVNTGITASVSSTTAQYNVYPTIVGLMRPDMKEGEYQGLGKNLLDPTLSGAVDPFGIVRGEIENEAMKRRAYEISDSIIRGDYFRLIGERREQH